MVEALADLLAPHGGQAKAQHEGQGDGGQGVQQGRDGQREVARQGHVGGLGDLVQGSLAHEGGEQVGGHQIGGRAGHQGGEVGQGHGDDEQLARAAAQVGDAHGHVGHDHQGDDEGQEGAEDGRAGDHHPVEPLRHKGAEEDAQDDGDDKLGDQAEFKGFLFHDRVPPNRFLYFWHFGDFPVDFPLKLV